MKTTYLSNLRLLTNRNFKIKVNGNGMSVLLGVSGLIKLLGFYRACNACEKALKSDMDIYIIKTRTGLRIRFYSK